jgi:YbbR domain-containing protein
MIFSFVVSFVLWCVISTYSALSEKNLETKVLSDIPITVNLSESAKEDGYRIFPSPDILKAQVSVTANRLILGQISKDDVQVIAQQSPGTIMSPGDYDFELEAKQNSQLKDFKISLVHPNFIKVMVDRFFSKDFEIENRIKFNSDHDCVVGIPNFSPAKVTVSGPEASVKKIKKVAAVENIDGVLKESTTRSSKLVFFDENDGVIVPELLTLSSQETKVTIPILFKKTVDIVPDFENPPEGLNLAERCTITPKSLEISGPKETIENLETLKLDPLAFQKIGPLKNVFELPIDIPPACKNLNNIFKATIEVNLHGFDTRIMCIKNFEFLNLPEGKKAEVKTSSISVTVVGPKSLLKALKEEDLQAFIDIKDKDSNSVGNKEMPLQIKAKNSCWVFGDYTVSVSIK